jgi:hypothetical protein
MDVLRAFGCSVMASQKACRNASAKQWAHPRPAQGERAGHHLEELPSLGWQLQAYPKINAADLSDQGDQDVSGVLLRKLRDNESDNESANCADELKPFANLVFPLFGVRAKNAHTQTSLPIS